MLRAIAGLAGLALCTTLVLAQNTGAIEQRKQAMKAMGGALKEPGAMAKGEGAFDLAKVQASLKSLQADASKLKALWPEDSKTGGNTRALPAIWTNMKDYLDWFDGLANDAKAAEASIKDEASFKAAWPNITDYCGSCHKDFRAPSK